jgi:ComF family protein
MTLPFSSPDVRCGACIKNPPAFDHTISFLRYTFPVDTLIKRFKFQRELKYLQVLSHLFREYLFAQYKNKSWPSALIPVPLHPLRLQERGYNQSIIMAQHLKLTIPVLLKSCYRTRHTSPQHDLPFALRHKNMKKAFAVKKNNTLPSHIAIIDDVMTTGETANTLATVLKKAGVARVDVWCLARTEKLL